MVPRSLLRYVVATAALALAFTITAPFLVVAASAAQTQAQVSNPEQEFKEAINFCANAIVKAVNDEGKELLLERQVPGGGKALKVIRVGEGLLRIQGIGNNGQNIDTVVSLGVVVFDVLSLFPGNALFGIIGEPAARCLQASFIYTGQLGTHVGETLRKVYFTAPPISDPIDKIGPGNLPKTPICKPGEDLVGGKCNARKTDCEAEGYECTQVKNKCRPDQERDRNGDCRDKKQDCDDDEYLDHGKCKPKPKSCGRHQISDGHDSCKDKPCPKGMTRVGPETDTSSGCSSVTIKGPSKGKNKDDKDKPLTCGGTEREHDKPCPVEGQDKEKSEKKDSGKKENSAKKEKSKKTDKSDENRSKPEATLPGEIEPQGCQYGYDDKGQCRPGVG